MTIALLEHEEYVTRMEQAGLFSSSAENCEHDPRIWRHYFAAVKEKISFDVEAKVALAAGKYGFCYELNDPDRLGLNFALVTPMVDPFLPVTYAQFMQDLPALKQDIENT